MNNNINIDDLKAEFWERIRPRSKEEIEEEEMMIKVKDHYDKLVDDLFISDGFSCNINRISTGKQLLKLKEELNTFIKQIKDKG